VSDKNEKPTPKKIKDARIEGQVAKSTDVTTGVQLAILLGFFWWRGESTMLGFQDLMRVSVASILLPLPTALDRIIGACIALSLELLLPMALVLIVGTIGSVLAQIGPIFSPRAVQPKSEHVSVLKNAKSLFSMKSVFEFCKSVIKVSVLTWTTYLLMKDNLGSFQFLSLCGIECGVRVTGQMIFWLWGTLVLCYIVFGGADLAYQKRQLTKQLMMSHDEILKEMKNAEGDPEVKRKRKDEHGKLSRGALASNVKRSTVVVRNPTHFAVCIYYKPGETPLPQVIDKGGGIRALHIICLAEAAGVPLVEQISLARSLHSRIEIGDYIPADLFEPVAEVLHLVNEMQDESLDAHETLSGVSVGDLDGYGGADTADVSCPPGDFSASHVRGAYEDTSDANCQSSPSVPASRVEGLKGWWP
jgi:type III secretion protein U